MTPENLPNIAPEPAPMGVFARLAGVIFEPMKTFEDIARRPTFLVPMALVIVFGLVFMSVFSQRVGWEKTIRERLDSSPQGQSMSAEDNEEAIASGRKMASVFGYAWVIVATPVVNLVVAGVLLGIAAGMMSAPIGFKQVFAVVCWSYVVTTISMGLSIVVMCLKNPEDFDLKNPLMSNLGALFEPNMPSKFLHSLATSLDFFAIWVALLLAAGLKAAGGKRFSFAGALTAVLLPWGAVVLIKATFASIF